MILTITPDALMNWGELWSHKPKKLRPGWKIIEEVGIVVINDWTVGVMNDEIVEEEITHHTWEDFCEAKLSAMRRGYNVEIRHKPKTLRCGFIVREGAKIIHHTIRCNAIPEEFYCSSIHEVFLEGWDEKKKSAA